MGLNGVNNPTVALINSPIQSPAYSDTRDSINLYYGKSVCVSERVYVPARETEKRKGRERYNDSKKHRECENDGQ